MERDRIRTESRLDDPRPTDDVREGFENGVLEMTLDVPDRGRREIPIEAAGTDTPRHEGGLRAAVESRNRERESDRSARP